MYVIILAAGRGSRLGGAVPKPLAEVAPGLTLLGNQVKVLARLVGRHRICVVVGHAAMHVVEAHPDLMFVHNVRYASTNTAKSLLCALPKFDDDVMWINGDLYFEEPAARLLVERHSDFSRTLVDHSKTGDEEIKYTVFPDGSIDQISKTIEGRQALGESLGLQIVTRRDRGRLQRALEEVGEKDYFERALELCTQDRSIRLMPVDVGRHFCREVDFPEDLEAVRNHVVSTAKPGQPSGTGESATPSVSGASPAAGHKPALT
jgi:choline kinase